MKVLLPVAVGAMLLFFGVYVTARLALYTDFPYLDSVMHTIGGAIVGWAILAYADHRHLPRPSLLWLLTLTLLIGLAWELTEALSGKYLDNTFIYHYFHGGGPLDTVADVILDVTGALIAFGRYNRLIKSSPGSEFPEVPNHS